MLDVLIDTFIDLIKILPFLFIGFLLIELLEHKFSEKSKKFISKSGRFGSIFGGFLGAIPQCGFSVLATNLYITRIITLGTLISIYLSTSDEMLLILLVNKVPFIEILKIVGIKIMIGIISGTIIDLIIRKQHKKDFHICEDDDCDCEHSLMKSVIKHTMKTFLFIGIVTICLNTLSYFGENYINKIFLTDSIFAPFLSSLVGLIPNCAASVLLTELYLNGAISLGTSIGGLLTGSGVALLVLFKNNKNLKENLIIVSIIYIIGVISGIILNILL